MVDHVPAGLDAAPLLIVGDTFEALNALGRAARRRCKAKIVAVTGSVGKTSVKEALKLVLSRQAKTAATLGNLNNQWGVPLSLARMAPDTVYGVFEMGMNHPGELDALVAAGPARCRGDHDHRAGPHRILRVHRRDRRRQGRDLQRHARRHRRAQPRQRLFRDLGRRRLRPRPRPHRRLRRASRRDRAGRNLDRRGRRQRGQRLDQRPSPRLSRGAARPALGDQQPGRAGGRRRARRRPRRRRRGARRTARHQGPRRAASHRAIAAATSP